MFTWAEIDGLHARFGRAESLGDYLRAPAAIGVVRFESFVADGHSEFYGADGYSVVSPAHHALLRVADGSNRDAFLHHLRDHGEGKTSYLEMSTGSAQSGVEKWVADTSDLTMTCARGGVVLPVDDVA